MPSFPNVVVGNPAQLPVENKVFLVPTVLRGNGSSPCTASFHHEGLLKIDGWFEHNTEEDNVNRTKLMSWKTLFLVEFIILVMLDDYWRGRAYPFAVVLVRCALITAISALFVWHFYRRHR